MFAPSCRSEEHSRNSCFNSRLDAHEHERSELKRPSPYLRRRHQRLARFRAAERARRAPSPGRLTTRRHIPPGAIIRAPTTFNLTRGAGTEVVRFLRAVARRVLIEKQSVRLDMRLTQQFYVPGALFLFAELDRIISLSDQEKPISIIDPWQRKPRAVLKQIGIHRLTGDSSNVVPSGEDVVFWRATKGSKYSGDDMGQILEFVADRANREHARQVETKGIWRGLSEAVNNTLDHAYSLPREDGFEGLESTKWWMFTQVREGQFTAAVCDLGCGYRATVNRNIPELFRAGFQRLLAGTNLDVSAIKIAMEYGRSGTHEEHRGKGSRDALSVVKNHGSGSLFVLSNTGWVTYRCRGTQEQIDSGALDLSIRGTIVWWHLDLT